MTKLDRQMDYLGADRLSLRRVELRPEIEAEWAAIEEQNGKGATKLRQVDIARHSWVLDQCRGESLLDVGAGHGLLVGAANRSEEMHALGIDIHPSRFITASAVVMQGDGRDLSGGDDHWDTVTALEVVEHQEDGDVERMLAELRRVAKLRVIVTVPFDQNPLPDYHRQRFNAGRMLRLFPKARFTLLEKPRGTPWVAAIEDVG